MSDTEAAERVGVSAYSSKAKRKAAPSRQSHACRECGKVFSRAEYVRRHHLSKHAQTTAIPCPHCEVNFSRHDLLSRHVKLFHAGAEVPKAPFAPVADVDLPLPLPVYHLDGEVAGPATGGDDPSPTTSTPTHASTASPAEAVVPSPSASFPNPKKRPRISSPEPVVPHTSPLSNSPLPDIPFDFSDAEVAPASFTTVDDDAFSTLLQALEPTGPLFDSAQALPAHPFSGLFDPQPSPSSSALVQHKPMHWAVKALPGSEEDWKDDEEGGDGNNLATIIDLIQRRPKEPSMYPAHLFSEQRGHGSRFFMPSQRFCIAYLYPWEIPPLPRLSRFAAQAYEFILPVLSLVHRPTLSMVELAPPFAFALSVVGAGLFQSDYAFHTELSHVKRIFAAEHLSEVIVHEEERMVRAQTLLLYNLVGAYSNSHEERDFTRRYHPDLVQAFLDIDAPDPHVPRDLNLPPADLDRAWKAWVEHETYLRVAFLCYLVDLQTGATFGENQRLLSHSHAALADLPLPASEALWNAGSAAEWRAQLEKPALGSSGTASGSAPPLFKDALNALLARAPPKHGSPAARTLSALPHLSPLAITVLFQTLLSLQSQITASQLLLRSFANPAQSTLGAVAGTLGQSSSVAVPNPDLLEAAASSAKESMERILFGLRVLKLLGGAAATRFWFKGIEPIFA
ncbi:hypothetical protein JCM10207_008074 [Rhodosporidiobolus poonsookiae]